MTKKRFVFIVAFLSFSFLYAGDVVHIIKKGDTLYGISRKYKIPVDQILKRNNIKDASKIKAGQKLYIPKKTNTSAKTSNNKTKIYKIKKGDSLFAIAKKFGLNYTTLMKLNGLSKNSILKIGQTIKIPTTSEVIKSGKKIISSKKSSKKQSSKKESSLKAISSKKANSKLLWPVPTKEVFYLSGKVYGVVINSKKGETVKAIASGEVASTGPHRGYGQVVFIRTKTKHIFVYGGLSTVSVRKGQKIKVGQKLGNLGTELLTGDARLYFMVYNKKNRPIDPAKVPRGF